VTVTPAYNRDYKSLAAAKADWDANKDFVIAEFGHRYDGKPTNKEQCVGEVIMVRYAKLRKIGRVQ
jgi:hypothetical protein